MVLAPLVEGTIYSSLIGAAYLAMLLSTVFALSKRHILWVASLILAAPATMGAIAHDLDLDSAYPFLFYARMITFCIFAIITIFVVKVGATEEVTPDTIAAAACIYMLLGITWSLIFTSMLIKDPTAITGVEFEGLLDVGADVTDLGAEIPAYHLSVLAELRQDLLCGVDGHREAQVLAAGVDGGVDSDHLAENVDKRTA